MGAACSGISNPGRLSFAGSSTGPMEIAAEGWWLRHQFRSFDDSGTVEHRFGQFVQRSRRGAVAGKLDDLGRGFRDRPASSADGLPASRVMLGAAVHGSSPRISLLGAAGEAGAGQLDERSSSAPSRTSTAAKDIVAPEYCGAHDSDSAARPPRAASVGILRLLRFGLRWQPAFHLRSSAMVSIAWKAFPVHPCRLRLRHPPR